jgi:hypothetical protein
MGFSNIGTYACRALQQKLEDYYGANVPARKTMGSTSLVRFLLSPQNTAGFNQITDAITGLPTAVPGKKRAIAFAVDLPFCFDVCSLEGITCTTEHTNLDNNTQEIVFDFDDSSPFRPCNDDGDPLKLEFTRTELKKYCTETDTSYITRKIAAFNKRFIEAFDKRMGEILGTLVGQNANNESITNIPFFIEHTSGMQTMNPAARWYLDQLYLNIGGEGQYALVGGQVLSKIIQYQKWAGLADAGIDLATIDDMNPFAYYDRFLDTTLGLNQFFQLSPGAVQLVTFNDYVGEYNREVTDLYTNSTFIDRATGLEVDFEWRFDPDCQVWTYKPHLSAELAVAIPGGCGIPNANGVLLINDCSGGANAPACPESSVA